MVGSLKFDAAQLDERRLLNLPALLARLGWPSDATILLGGSTHAGEEALLAEQFLRLRARFPKLYLILVPRHFERCRQVGRELSARGVKFVYRNELTGHADHPRTDAECLLVNTTGELKYFYECASVIFVGKSLTAEGGQNPIEPGAQGKAMVFGPNMQNFSDIVRAFLAQDGAVQVRDAAELEKVLGNLLQDDARRAQLGQNALKVVHENLGAVHRTVDMILQHLDCSEYYVAPEVRPPLGR